MSAWRALLAGLIVIGLGAALAYVVLQPADEGTTAPTLAQAPQQTPAGNLTASPEAHSAVATTSTPAETVGPQVVTSTGTTAPSVVAAMQAALAAWGQFAVTGEMRDLGDHFVVGGPQRRQLRAESAAIRNDPPGPPPYEVEVAEVFTVSVTPGDIVLRAAVTWRRSGAADQSFTWDIQMRLVDGSWKLFTVEEVVG